jgi:hypothetical protein
MTEQPQVASRRRRTRRIRQGVAASAVTMFVMALGAVIGFGRQPAAKATARASSPPAGTQSSDPSGDGPGGWSDGGGAGAGSDPGGSGSTDGSGAQSGGSGFSQGPAPMTTGPS